MSDRKSRNYAQSTYLLVSTIRIFLMHDISTMARSEAEAVASYIDNQLTIKGGVPINGAKIVAIPHQLSVNEYLTLATVWPIALEMILFPKKEYEDDLRQAQFHWMIIEILVIREKLNGGPGLTATVHKA